MTDYLTKVRKLQKKFIIIEVKYVSRDDSCLANSLACKASSRSPRQHEILKEKLSKLSMKSSENAAEGVVVYETYNQLEGSPGIDAPKGVTGELVAQLKSEVSWMIAILMYLQDRVVPEDDALDEQIFHRSKMYTLVDDVIYRKDAHGELLKCISQKQGRELLEEIH
ncbi:uncharacterized protein LOC133890297 [Phragmites australis]|uniref:uncharacterized protein LOC133890297 n=1 Tax=Phragmites australis TaxID=29695 RepID=UPI002D769E83|nr:uncharacterized protein LOC133890297 [Phragmites australis]